MLRNWKGFFESMDLKVILGKPKVMVNEGITKDGLSKSKVDTYGIYRLSVRVSIILCVQCGKWFHSRCASMSRVALLVSGDFACRECGENV